MNILYQEVEKDREKQRYFIPNSFLIEYDNKGMLRTYEELNKEIEYSEILNDFSKYKTSIEEESIEYYQKQYKGEYEKVKNKEECDEEKLQTANNKIIKYDYLKKAMNLKLLEKKIKFDYDISCRMISEVRKFDNLKVKRDIRNSIDYFDIRNSIDHFDYLSKSNGISILYKNIANYYIWLNDNNYLKERNALKEILSTHLKNNKIDFLDIRFTKDKIDIIDCKPLNNSFLESNKIKGVQLMDKIEMDFLLYGVVSN